MKLIDADEEGNLTITPEAYKIKEFKKIWGRRGGTPEERRDRAEKELVYIVLFEDPSGSYASYYEDERQELLKDALDLGDEWEEDRAIKEARKRYRELIDTPSTSLLRAANKTLVSLREYFEDVDFRKKEAKQTSFDTSKVLKQLKDADEMGKLIEDWEKRIEKERKSKKDIKKRGGGEISKYNKPETYK